MIIPVYKPYGASTHQLALQVGELYGEKATHTGTLDPAAEGVVIVLSGEDRYKKEELAATQKVYIAQVLFGIATDTHDLIGLPQDFTQVNQEINADLLKSILEKLTGTYDQTLPAFSAKRIDGQSYFDLARDSKDFKRESREVTINKIELLSSIKVSSEELQTFHNHHLSLILGDFRQDEISKAWKPIFKDQSLSYHVSTLSITCSKRTYIRALVRDIGEALGVPATLYLLIRTQNGPYSIKDCVSLAPSSQP